MNITKIISDLTREDKVALIALYSVFALEKKGLVTVISCDYVPQKEASEIVDKLAEENFYVSQEEIDEALDSLRRDANLVFKLGKQFSVN